MTYKEESYILESISQIREEVHENNRMLSGLCSVVNTWLAHHHQENEDDFNRNILANIVSQFIDFRRLKQKRQPPK